MQGCSIRCTGCAIPQAWNRDGGEDINVEDLANRIISTDGIEGVTFVGGEPFDQADALADLGAAIQQAGLSVLTFTGYLYEELLAAKNVAYERLLSVTDLIIDGPYLRDFADYSRPWVGSSNQRYFFLTDRYRHLKPILHTIPNRLEVRLQPNGTVLINGMGDIEAVRSAIQL